MCLYQTWMKNPRFKTNKKNGGIIPAVKHIKTLSIPKQCGNCIECRKQKARDWQVRLHEEIKTNPVATFVTLTFSNESIQEITGMPRTKTWPGVQDLKGYELDNAIAKRGVRLFLENWRKKTGKSVRHWLITELGHNGTENIHLHGIIWSNNIELIRKTWRWGWIYPRSKEESKQNYVNSRTINYIIKYVTKIDAKHKTYKQEILASHKPGIGHSYTTSINSKNNIFNYEKTKEYYQLPNGQKVSLPKYYKNKLYTDEEKELLWIQKLEKGEIYIMKEQININKNFQQYLELLKWYRKLNKELGYGDNKINWSRKAYEEQRRNLLMQIRLGLKEEAIQQYKQQEQNKLLEEYNKNN